MLRERTDFETVFHLPREHHLDAIQSRTRIGAGESVHWTLIEYDSAGQALARYESWEEVDAKGAHRAGWRKYDQGGRVIHIADSF